MLCEVSKQVRRAEDLGYDPVSFTEHHFHIEGFEVRNNPLRLDLYFALQTQRIRIGQVAIVLPASTLVRLAEDVPLVHWPVTQ